MLTSVVDTSAWIHFFRRGDDRLRRLLEQSRAFVHPWIVYELELGSGIPAEDRALIARLPSVGVVSDEIARQVAHPLRGSRLGWVDVHVLAGAQAAGFALLTRDEPLRRAARKLGVRGPG